VCVCGWLSGHKVRYRRRPATRSRQILRDPARVANVARGDSVNRTNYVPNYCGPSGARWDRPGRRQCDRNTSASWSRSGRCGRAFLFILRRRLRYFATFVPNLFAFTPSSVCQPSYQNTCTFAHIGAVLNLIDEAFWGMISLVDSVFTAAFAVFVPASRLRHYGCSLNLHFRHFALLRATSSARRMERSLKNLNPVLTFGTSYTRAHRMGYSN